MNRTPEFPPMFLEYLKLARQAGSLSPVWLGGAGGAGGGGGSPPGGWIGQLPQNLVTYDTTEAATTSGSSSLVDNLNHIRYMIANAQYNAGVIGVEFGQTEYSGGDISLGLSADGGWVDVDATNAKISITPNSAGTFQSTFTFTNQITINTSLGAGTDTYECLFRITDGTTSLSPIKVSSDGNIPDGRSTSQIGIPVSMSGLFVWTTGAKTVKLQRWIQSIGAAITGNVVLAASGPAIHMDVFRLGSIATGFISGSGAAGRVAYWTSGSVLANDSTFTWDAANSRLGVGKLSLTSGSMSLAGNVFALDASMKIDPTGAINGQVLGYNGSKWVPVVSSGSQAATTGSGATGQFALWSATSALFGLSSVDYVAGSTSKVRVGHSGDVFALGVNSTPDDYVTLQATQPSWVGGTDPNILTLTPGTLTAQTGNPTSFLSQSGVIVWNNAFIPLTWAGNIFSPFDLRSTTSGGIIPVASTVRISGSPTSGSNATILSAYALEITSGSVYIGGPLSLAGKFFKLDATMEIDPSGATNGQVLTYSTSLGKWIAQVSSASGGGGASGIGGAGASSRIAYFTSGSVIVGDTNFAWDTTNQRMIIGGTPSDFPLGLSSSLAVIKESGTSGISLFEYGSSQASFFAYRANGTKASPSNLLAGDTIGGINISGYGATAWAASPRVKIQGVSSEAWSDTSQGMYLAVNVTRPGTTTSVDAFDVKYDRVSITGKDFILDANIELDPTSAVANQVLTYNGSKWIPQTFSGISGISGSGAVGQVAFWTSGSIVGGNSTFFWDTSSTPNKLIIGSNTSVISGPQLAIVSDSVASGISIEGYTVTPTIASFKAGGSKTSPTSVLSDQVMLSLTARGYRSGAFNNVSASKINFIATENWTSGSIGSDILFYTTGSGGELTVESLRIRPTSIDIVGKNFRLDAAMEIDPAGATSGSVLGYNGSKWIPISLPSGSSGSSGIFGSGANTEIAYFTSGNVIASSPSLTHSAVYAFDLSTSRSGNAVQMGVTNTSNTANSDSILNVAVGGTSGGSPWIYLGGGVANWGIVSDASDSGTLKIGTRGFGLSTFFSMDTLGNVAFTSGSISLSTKIFALDANFWVNPTGATVNQVLSYNGSKWVPATVSGAGVSGISGSGSNAQVAYFTSGSVIAGSNQFQWTTPSSGALLSISTTGSSGGDPAVLFRNLTSRSWIVGIDVSDSEKFVISSGSSLGTSDYLKIDSSGNMDIGGHTLSPQAYFSLDSTGKWTVKRDTTALSNPGSDFSFQGGFHSALNVEVNTAAFSASVVTTTGDISVFRNYLFSPGSFTGSAATKTIATAATVAIAGAPTASSNAVITTPLSLWVQAGLSSFVDGVVLGTLTSGSTGQLWQSSNQQRWNGNIIKFDGAMEFDPTSAVNGSYLAYNGTKWTLATPGTLSNAGGGSQYRIGIWNSSTTLIGDSGFTWDGFTFSIDPVTSVVNGAFETFLVKPPTYTYSNYLTEPIDIDFDLSHNISTPAPSSGSAGTQRAIVIRPPIYGFSGTTTINDMATVAITGAPTPTGIFITVTRNHALWVQSGEVLFAGGLDLGTASGATTGQLRQSAATQIWNGNTIQFDATMELDPFGATNGQALVYNGSKWVASSTGGVSGISGSGAANQVAYFTSGSVITSGSNFTFNGNRINLLTSGSTGGILFGLDTSFYRKSARMLGLGGGLSIDDGLNLGLVTGAANGQLKQSSSSIIFGSSTLTLDASAEVDASGATVNQVLTYNGSKWIAQTATSGSSSSGSLGWFNVKDYGATGNGSTDDTASISAAITALTSASGGRLYFPRGSYKTTGGFTITVPTLVLGDGNASEHGDVLLPDAPTRLLCSSSTADLLTFNSPGCSIRDLALINTSGSTPSAGAGLIIKGRDDNGHINDVAISGFYNCVDVQTSFLWHMDGCLILYPVNYGLKIADSYNLDWGDFTISNCQFHPGSRDGATAIRHESAGGMYMTNCKLDGWRATAMSTVYRFSHAYDLSPTSSTTSSIVQISNCSFENVSGDVITVNVTGGASWAYMILNGLQFGLYTITGHAIKLASNSLGLLKDITITGCVFYTDYGSAVSAVDLTNIQSVRLANNINEGFPSFLTQSGSSDVLDEGAADFQQTVYNTANITLGTVTDVAFVDADSTNAKMVFTPASSGKYRVTFTFTHYRKAATMSTLFALDDGTTQSTVQQSYTELATADNTVVISLSYIFSWSASSQTVKLKKKVTTATTVTSNEIEVFSGTTQGLQMEVFRIGS